MDLASDRMLPIDSSLAKYNTDVLKLVVICGATATGKSGLAIALAQRLHSAIISADSRLVYREFDIGTAKPTIAERQRVPHYLIDVCEPTDTMTVADYQERVWQIMAGEMVAGSSNPDLLKTPLLVGGTGLYIRAITRGLKIPRVPPQPALRSQLQSLGQPFCYALLQQVDPAAAARIHANDEVRTVRSLEVFYVTGRPMSEQQGENPPSYPILQIGLDCEMDALEQRIQQRTEQMVQMGFVEEVAYLSRKYGTDLPLLNTLGYAEFRRYLAGTLSLEAATAQTVLHTRQFAKRQRTWFHADPTIEWFDATAPDLLDQVWQRIEQFLST